MNELLLIISVALVVAQFALPRRLAFLPLLIAACHTPYQVALGGQFTAVRLVLLAGLLRAALGGWIQWNPRKPLDLIMVVWSAIALLSALGHQTGNPFMYRAGLVLNIFGTFLYTRAYVQTPADFAAMIRALAVVLIPLAALLALEAATGANAYHGLGSRFANAMMRGGRSRAMGPFGTPILAGTLGAVCIPLFVFLWRTNPWSARLGIGASVTMVVSSASSGPIGTLLLGSAALILWRWRSSLRRVKVAAVALLIVIQLFRDRSAWYLISLIDFVGGSTGWHRSRLLESAMSHLQEWWLCGTDYTNHWMPYVLAAHPDHCDITSYYVHLGVIGGLPLLIVFVAIIWRAFHLLGARMRQLRAGRSSDNEFMLWCVGSALFAHTVTFFTVSYFDQLFVFFYALVGTVPMLVSAASPAKARTPARPAAPRPRFSPQYVFGVTDHGPDGRSRTTVLHSPNVIP